MAWAGLVGCDRHRRLRVWLSLRLCAVRCWRLLLGVAAILERLRLAIAGRSGLRLTRTGELRRGFVGLPPIGLFGLAQLGDVMLAVTTWDRELDDTWGYGATMAPGNIT